tara:strand:+ start:890 stop:1408 length:519 start_codon:yes stop_codon:yes gene_type:complete
MEATNNYTVLVSFENTLNRETLSDSEKILFERDPEIYVIRKLLSQLSKAVDHGYLPNVNINIKALSIGDKNLIVSSDVSDGESNDQELLSHENSDALEPNDNADDPDTIQGDVIEDALSPPFPFEGNQTLETQEEEIPLLPPRQGLPAVTSRASQAALQSELTDYYTTDHLM